VKEAQMAATSLPDTVFEAARLGDPAAIAELLAITQPDIRRYARAACRTSADAEDAAQEALWLLFRRVGTIRSLAAMPGWLFTVVRRQCLRLARRFGLSVDPPADSPDLDRSDGELRLDLAAAIEALPDRYREIILLRDVREQTIGEIADQLCLTRPATKARLHRARELLRDYLTR
jgi:RNA polymerase sigma-70 factor (ECF subfamily)